MSDTLDDHDPAETARLPIRILVRTDVDWHSMDRTRFEEQSAEGTPHSFLRVFSKRSGLDVWDDAYDVDFFRFRGALRAVAESNLAAVHDARISVGFEDFSWYHGNDDEVIYPIDDDDYFHPDLASTSPAPDEDTIVVTWPHGQYTYDDSGHPQTKVHPMRILFSNNWGIRKSFLKAHFDEKAARHILADHAAASSAIADHLGVEQQPGAKWFQRQLDDETVRRFDTPFGVSLKHVGSLLTLTNFLRTDDPVARLRHQKIGERATIHPHLSWAEPWLRSAEDVFRSCAPPARSATTNG